MLSLRSIQEVRDARPADFAAIVALNAESERFLSPLGAARLEHLHAQCAYHRVIEEGGGIAGFLLAFREGADYDSPNYGWFKARYACFLYIDRLVVAPACRRRRYGSTLYEDVIAFARERGVPIVTCEYDITPPNEISRRFHERFGFREVGTQWYAAKQVSLNARQA